MNTFLIKNFSQCFNTKTVMVLFPGGSRAQEAPAFVSAQVSKAFKEKFLERQLRFSR